MDDANHVLLSKIKARTADVERTPTGRPVRGRKAEAVEQRIAELNLEIEALLSQIQTNANEFIKKHFFDNKDVIRLSLQFVKKFNKEYLDADMITLNYT